MAHQTSLFIIVLYSCYLKRHHFAYWISVWKRGAHAPPCTPSAYGPANLKFGSCTALSSSSPVTEASKLVPIKVESWSQTPWGTGIDVACTIDDLLPHASGDVVKFFILLGKPVLHFAHPTPPLYPMTYSKLAGLDEVHKISLTIQYISLDY